MTDNRQALKTERERTFAVVQELHTSMNKFDGWVSKQVKILGNRYNRIIVEFSYGPDHSHKDATRDDITNYYEAFERGKRPGIVVATVRSLDGGSVQLTEDLLDSISEAKAAIYREARRVEMPARRELYVARQVMDNARVAWREAERYAAVHGVEEEDVQFTSEFPECKRNSF